MTTVGLYPLLDRPEALEWAARAIQLADKMQLRPVLPPEASAAINRPDLALQMASWRQVDLALTFGGDGTLLQAATQVAALGVPLLGFNLGRVGFLTELEGRDLESGLAEALAGRYLIEERMMVEGSLVRAGQEIGRHVALNDLVITKGPFARLVRLQVAVGESVLGTYSADGLILATPTGSTAYALSAGGPVLTPEVAAILVTPICPHTLSSRSVVVPPDVTVSVELLPAGDRSETFLTVDGQLGERLEAGDRLTVRRSAICTRLLRRPGYDFLDVLRRKLSEGVL
ncbi:MAG: NAD(+)/NADH kinase [Sulfobacillus sp.]